MNDLAKLEKIVSENKGLVPGTDGRGHGPARLQLEHLRDLTSEDLAALAAAKGSQGTSPPDLKQLRHTHHLLARLLAEGKSNEEASLLTGYDPVRISVLKNSPSFENLLAYYATQESAKDIDFRLRIAGVGMDFVDEMHRRLQEAPDEISFGQVRESAESLLGMSGLVGAPGKGAPLGSGQALNFNISFVAPAAAGTAPEGASGPPTVEGVAERVE